MGGRSWSGGHDGSGGLGLVGEGALKSGEEGGSDFVFAGSGLDSGFSCGESGGGGGAGSADAVEFTGGLDSLEALEEGVAGEDV